MTEVRTRAVGWTSERGTGLAELALVLPLLIAILFGIIELGIALNRAQAVEAASREGARLASLSSSSVADIDARAQSALAGIPLDNVAVDVDALCAGRQGEQVTVTVTADHDLNIPLVVTRTLSLEGQAIFRCEA